MSSKVDQAIVTRWDAKSLDSTFDGGIHAFRSPTEETWPYVVFYPISEVPAMWTTAREVRQGIYQFSIWMKESSSQDPVKQLGDYMDTLKSAYEFAPLTITSQDVILMERQSETQEVEEDQVWHGIITYRVRRSIAANYSPA